MHLASELGPITFKPIFVERIWGGQKLASFYGKHIPCDCPIGESWEIVDRAEAQSIVNAGPLTGRSLHDLWTNLRPEIFGKVRDTPRFPLLVKLLDCQDKLSLQVHPPRAVAANLGGEPKTECWYIADASREAEVYLGLRAPIAPETFRDALTTDSAAEFVHRMPVATGDAFLVPSGRIHAIGAGSLIVEVQQNSDTTFRVYDWNRKTTNGKSRELHIEESMSCIDFNDRQPKALSPEGETIVSHELFAIERWELQTSREVAPRGSFAIVFCLKGSISCRESRFHPGDFFLLPANAVSRSVESTALDSSLLRITIP
jgi:mannose-6-phosphate isomerase